MITTCAALFAGAFFAGALSLPMQDRPSAGAVGQETGRASPIPAILAEVSAERIRARIERLVSFHTRHTASETQSETRGIGAARRWIEADLRESARLSGGRLQVRVQAFDAEIRMGRGREPLEVEIVNVYGFLPGTIADPKGRTYVVCGHYDSRAGSSRDVESAAPGADDDASGTAVVLELARAMSRHEFEANLVFLCVAGEEQGLFGSKHFAEWAESEGIFIDGVIADDIVGGVVGGNGVRDERTIRCYSEAEGLHSPSRELARAMKASAERWVPAANIRLVFRLDRFQRGGDHIPFHRMGVPAVRLSEANEHYGRQHQDVRIEDGVQYGDLVEFVSMEYVAHVARVNGATLGELALAPAPPSNIRMRAAVRYDTELSWTPSPSESVAGYEVVWRDTAAPTWEHVSAVTQENTLTIDGVTADTHFFGVRAVDRAGHRSRVVVPERR